MGEYPRARSLNFYRFTLRFPHAPRDEAKRNKKAPGLSGWGLVFCTVLFSLSVRLGWLSLPLLCIGLALPKMTSRPRLASGQGLYYFGLLGLPNDAADRERINPPRQP
jgi:hypothetical protein